ncbi:multicomponent Na+:H+ antiporter subunit D [Sedimentibacter acidaminivorans]|jgi:multicomponent Na+:H+ antiporter subunit D|uniref:Multicomponent Na+:H+ antiporter subunit D n=1 Tax=Sedimentibacter acidaminivorans TaxID=913099 RepID=A0ABS4GE82_9FIRM|nr:proton-conducting transporter membrane subunit [Sedimentibacter acidaminivorans]MBP1926005.1 multicomponent Na+:H+ antiporter subunit D [Sedimentibacter acidaminivorans]
MNNIILLPIIFPFLAAIIIAVCNFTEKRRNIFAGSIIFLNLIFVSYIVANFNGISMHVIKMNEFLDIYFKVDKLSVFFSLLVSVLWLFTSIYAMEYMKHEGKEKRFFAYFILTLGVTLGIAFAGNLITLYLFYELLTLTTFPLVIHSGSKEALKSGMKYLIYSFTGATVALLGMLILFSLTNNLTFVPGGVINANLLDNKTLYFIIYVSMFIGFGVKAALVPFHSWLPAAMVAPTPVSSLLHAVAVVKSGIFAITRVTFYIFGANAVRFTGANKYLIILVIISILMGSFLALHQENLKKRLAYSTISQLGYILLGILLLNKNAFIGAMMHLLNHAVIKITLFFCVGAIMYTTGKTKISEINGIGKSMNITMFCFTISSISLIGIPPTNGFISKWLLAEGSLVEGKIGFPVILLLSALLTAMYLFPISIAAFFTKDESNVLEKKKAPIKMLIPIVCITVITVFLGLFPNFVLDFLRAMASEIMN